MHVFFLTTLNKACISIPADIFLMDRALIWLTMYLEVDLRGNWKYVGLVLENFMQCLPEWCTNLQLYRSAWSEKIFFYCKVTKQFICSETTLSSLDLWLLRCVSLSASPPFFPTSLCFRLQHCFHPSMGWLVFAYFYLIITSLFLPIDNNNEIHKTNL